MHTKIIAALIALSFSLGVAPAQKTKVEPRKSAQDKKGEARTKWVADKVEARWESAYLDGLYVYLVYTVTNKSGRDIRLVFRRDGVFLAEQERTARAYWMSTKPVNYTEIYPNPTFFRIDPELLPDELPVQLTVSFYLEGEHNSLKSRVLLNKQERLWVAIEKDMGGMDALVLRILASKLEIILPMPKRK